MGIVLGFVLSMVFLSVVVTSSLTNVSEHEISENMGVEPNKKWRKESVNMNKIKENVTKSEHRNALYNRDNGNE